jgi:hypothetical protein
LDCGHILGILDSLNPKSYNMRVIDHGYFCFLTKFHNFICANGLSIEKYEAGLLLSFKRLVPVLGRTLLVQGVGMLHVRVILCIFV